MTDEDIPNAPFVFHSAPSLNVVELNQKLDWIAAQLFRDHENMTDIEISEYLDIFSQSKPKQERNRCKGLFLRDES